MKVLQVVAAVVLWSVPEALAQPGPEAVRHGKAATALVLVDLGPQLATGSAFCLGTKGLFVTNAHVVEGSDGTRPIRLVLESGEAGQRIVEARVVRADRESDLALLHAEAAELPDPLELGDEADLAEAITVAAFGYPLGTVMALGGNYPNLNVNVARVTALRRRADQSLAAIQLDGKLLPGNSGGPVLDDRGRVVGVVRAGVVGLDLNFAIPVGLLRRFLDAPLIRFDPPPIRYRDRFEEVEWTVELERPFGGLLEGYQLEVEVAPRGTTDRIRAEVSQLEPGVFQAKIRPLRPNGDARSLEVVADFGDRQVEGRVDDHEVAVGPHRVMLNEVARVRPGGDSPGVVLDDGTALDGPVSGLGIGSKIDGQRSLDIPLGEAREVRFPKALPGPDQLVCAVKVSRGAEVVATDERVLDLVFDRPRSVGLLPFDRGGWTPPALPEPDLPDGPVERKLPGRVRDAVVGGGGRFLLLPLAERRQLVIFDVTRAEVARVVPLPSDDALVAAGAESFLVVAPEQKLLQRWGLSSLEREQVAPAPGDDPIRAIALGCDARGPALVWFEAGPRARFGLLDPVTFRLVEGYRVANGRAGGSPPIQVPGRFAPSANIGFELPEVRASADGHLFSIVTGLHAGGVAHAFVLDGRQVRMFDGRPLGFVVPGPDGRFLFCGRAPQGLAYDPALLTGALGTVRPSSEHPQTPGAPWSLRLPALDPGLDLDLRIQSASPGPDQPVRFERVSAVVRPVGRDATVLDLGVLEEMSGDFGRLDHASEFPLDRRFLLVPEADVLVTIPPESDRLVFRRLGLDAAARSEGGPLRVATSPLRMATRGVSYRDRVGVRPKVEGLRVELNVGPPGMTVGPDGILAWDVPEDFEPREVRVVLTIGAPDGREILHSFSLRVH